jgi:hypothetical protein
MPSSDTQSSNELEFNMTPTDKEFRARLSDLGARIQKASKDLETKGVLQGETREKAVALQVEHNRLEDLAQSRSGGPVSALTLAREFDGLKLNFEKWFAEIDKHFESGF